MAAIKSAPAIREESRGGTAHQGSETRNVPGLPQAPAAEREASSGAAPPAKEAARPAEPDLVPTPFQPPSRDVLLRLADGPRSVDIRMAERAGEIRVMVHTPDHDLANSLRNDLPDLVGKLRQNGFQAETWRPNAPAEADANRRSGAESFAGSSQQHSGNRKDGRQQQKQSQDQSRWAGEWNLSRGLAQESTT